MYVQFSGSLFVGLHCFPKGLYNSFSHILKHMQSKQCQCLTFVTNTSKNDLCSFVCIYSFYELSVYSLGLDVFLKNSNVTVTYISFIFY